MALRAEIDRSPPFESVRRLWLVLVEASLGYLFSGFGEVLVCFIALILYILVFWSFELRIPNYCVNKDSLFLLSLLQILISCILSYFSSLIVRFIPLLIFLFFKSSSNFWVWDYCEFLLSIVRFSFVILIDSFVTSRFVITCFIFSIIYVFVIYEAVEESF